MTKPDICNPLLSALLNANSILLCTHISPDGDAIGSTLAMGMGLKSLGKQVTMACADPVPEKYCFLPHAGEFVTPDRLEGKTFDAAMNLDSAEMYLIGDCAKAYSAAPVRLQIDHHPDNPRYAQINWVDGTMSAAGVLVFYALKAMGAPIDKDMAACIYCALSTDTGNFRFTNTNAQAFQVMAELMETGFDLGDAARRLHSLKEKPHLKLLGRALTELQFFCAGRCAGMALTQADYQFAGAGPEHRENIVNYAMDIPGVEIAYLADEREDGTVKVSLRSLSPWDVSFIARKFGGGGHARAAAFSREGRLDEIIPALRMVIEAAMEGNQ